MQVYEWTHIKSKHGIYFSSGCVNTEDLCIVPDKVSPTEKIILNPLYTNEFLQLARDYKTFFMLNSAEYKNYPAHKC